MSRKQGKPRTLTATEALDQFGDLPDGAALAAGADVLGVEYDDFIDMLANEYDEAQKKGSRS